MNSSAGLRSAVKEQGGWPWHTYLVAHDGQEVHSQVLYIHSPLSQRLSRVRVHQDLRQARGSPALVQGLNSSTDLRDRLKWEERQAAEWVGGCPRLDGDRINDMSCLGQSKATDEKDGKRTGQVDTQKYLLL